MPTKPGIVQSKKHKLKILDLNTILIGNTELWTIYSYHVTKFYSIFSMGYFISNFKWLLAQDYKKKVHQKNWF